MPTSSASVAHLPESDCSYMIDMLVAEELGGYHRSVAVGEQELYLFTAISILSHVQKSMST